MFKRFCNHERSLLLKIILIIIINEADSKLAKLNVEYGNKNNNNK